jgi:hypothetical protein
MAWDLKTLLGSPVTDPGPRAVEAPRGKPTHFLKRGRLFSADDPRLDRITDEQDNAETRRIEQAERQQRTEASRAELERRRRELTVSSFVPSTDERDAHTRVADAIRALAAHHATMADWRARYAAARAPVEKLESNLKAAGEEVPRAMALLAEFDDKAQDEIDRWAAAGAEGEKPNHFIGDRVLRNAGVAQAKRDVAMLEGPVAAARAGLLPIETEGRELHQQLTNFAATVMYEEAELLGHRYNAALWSLVVMASELRALNSALANFSGVTTNIPKIGDVSPPAIAAREEPLRFEERLSVRGFWLRAHDYSQILTAVVTVDEIKASAVRWSRYGDHLMTAGDDADEETLRERGRLLDENADLRARLAASGITITPRPTSGEAGSTNGVAA